jgi:hypothetical protein
MGKCNELYTSAIRHAHVSNSECWILFSVSREKSESRVRMTVFRIFSHAI